MQYTINKKSNKFMKIWDSFFMETFVEQLTNIKNLINFPILQKLYWNEIQKNCYCVILWTILEQLLTHSTLLFVLIICHSRHVFCLLPTFYLEDSIYTYNSMPKVVKLHKADSTWSRLSKNNNQYENHYGWFSKNLENLISESIFGVIKSHTPYQISLYSYSVFRLLPFLRPLVI